MMIGGYLHKWFLSQNNCKKHKRAQVFFRDVSCVGNENVCMSSTNYMETGQESSLTNT